MKPKGRDVPPKSGTDPRTRLPGETRLGQVYVSSGYGMNSRQPFVEIELPGQPPMQLEVDEAAEQDGALTEWVRATYTDLSADEQNSMAGGLLNEIRTFREKRRNKARTRSA